MEGALTSGASIARKLAMRDGVIMPTTEPSSAPTSAPKPLPAPKAAPVPSTAPAPVGAEH